MRQFYVFDFALFVLILHNYFIYASEFQWTLSNITFNYYAIGLHIRGNFRETSVCTRQYERADRVGVSKKGPVNQADLKRGISISKEPSPGPTTKCLIHCHSKSTARYSYFDAISWRLVLFVVLAPTFLPSNFQLCVNGPDALDSLSSANWWHRMEAIWRVYVFFLIIFSYYVNYCRNNIILLLACT